MGLENIFYLENFDCPTDEIIVKSCVGKAEAGMSAARLAGQAYASSPRDPLSGPAAAGDDDEEQRQAKHVRPRDVIVIPAGPNSVELQEAIQQVSANGVTVLDVRSLASRGGARAGTGGGGGGGGGGSSGRSSPADQPVVVQSSEGEHYIAVTGDGGSVGYHVQYVEPQELYSQGQQGQTQMSYPVYTVGEAAPVYGSSASSVAAGSGTGGGAGGAGGQWSAYATAAQHPTSHHYLLSGAQVDEAPSVSIVNLHRSSPQTISAEEQAGQGSYLSTGGGGEDVSAAQNAAHAARTSPATVQWLLENYENAEGVSLPRSTLYNHYLRHCTHRDLEPVNAASFGKLIRSVFLGLRTRRLGTRGNSKYHYYGIRVKPGSPLSNIGSQHDGGGSLGAGGGGKTSGGSRYSGRSSCGAGQRPSSAEQTTNTHMHQHHQYLGDGNGAIPDFPEINFSEPLPGECTLEDVDTLRSIYREHCEAFLDAVLSLELSTVESLWREFWRQNNNNDADECEEEKYLSKTKLYQLCGLAEVQAWVRTVDVAFYQRLVQVLLPDVLRPIPSPLTQAIRNFAKGLESWLVGAMGGCPHGMVRAKAAPAAALAQSLRRYTSLNHLAQAARAVLHNSQQIHQMLADLNRVDFHNVQEQASWVCQCPGAAVAALEADFKRTLQRQASLEQWAAWLEAAVRRALRPHEHSPRYAHHARQFLLKWSFYSSMVIRDLTLRSAASFGSFHLIRLLYDEYMFYLIEHRVAAHQGSAPIQVMAEKELMNGCMDVSNDYEELDGDVDGECEGEGDGEGDGEEEYGEMLVPLKSESPPPPPSKKIKIS